MQPNQQDSAQGEWASRLCPECGLCCNGVLFADVRLVEGDDRLVLEELGFRIDRSGEKPSFAQPCSCFDGRLCSAYEHRPMRCRQFDCHTLKQAIGGEIPESQALARVRDAKVEAEKVRELLRVMGQTDEHQPLTQRYQAAMSQPIDLSRGDDEAERRGELMLAVNSLMHRLQREFLA